MTTLKHILESFNAPLNEEQAWGICYQCAKFLENQWIKNTQSCFKFNGVESVALGKDGVVQSVVSTSGTCIQHYLSLRKMIV